MRERIAWVDIAKSICIILMVIGHYTSNELLLTYIYSFHMPALFIISGVLYKPSSYIKTIIAFSIPVLFFSVLNAFYFYLIGDYSFSPEYYKPIINRFLQYRYGLGVAFFPGVWFIWTLVGLRFIFGGIYRINSSKLIYTVGILVSITIIIYMCLFQEKLKLDALFHGYYFARVLPCFPFFFFGIMLRNRMERIYNLNKYIVLILLILFILNPIICGKCDINSNIYKYNYLIFVLLAVCSSLLTFYISTKIKPNILFETISKGTLLILGSHIILLKIFDSIIPQQINFIVPFISILSTCYPIILSDKYCPILLGKRKKHKEELKR